MNISPAWSLLPVLAAESIVVLLLVYLWRTRERHPGLAVTAIGLGVIVTGLVGYALARFEQPPPFGPFVFALLAGVGNTLVLNGFLIMVLRPTRWRAIGAIFVGAFLIVGGLFLVMGRGYFVLAQATVASAMAAAYLTAAEGIYRAQGDLGRRTPQVLALVVALTGIGHLIRATVIATGHWLPDAPDFGDIQAVNAVVQLVFVLIMLVTVVQIIGDRLAGQLHASREALAAAFQVASDGFALFDRQGRLHSVNDRVASLFPDLAGRLVPGADFATLFGATPARYGLTADFVARPRTAFDAQSEPRPDFWLRVVASPSPSGMLVCWTDVSDFKRAERLLQQELGRERDLARLRTGFVSMASHEFRTPLAIIDVAAQRLAPRNWPPPREQAAESARRIREAVTRMLRLIDTMLAPAATRSEGMTLKAAPTDLRALAADICARHQAAMGTKTIAQDLAGLPPVVVCDAELVGHALDHLVGNADKYSPGTAGIRVAGTTAGGQAVITVSDAGIGIPAADRALVFERYFRATNALAFQGTGMGLGLVREIATLHGGTVEIDSTLCEGTTITLRLPIDVGN